MAVNMSGNGKIASGMAKALGSILMAINTSGNGKMIREMAKARIPLLMAVNMSGNTKMVRKNGQGTYTNIAGQSVTEVWEMGSYIGTKAEVDEQERARKAEEARKVQAKKEAEDKFKKIYNACLLDKSSKIDMQVMALKEALEATCEAIAKNPSWYEELKYN